MRWAVISDIHGNLPALEAVLEDAERNRAEGYILAGDYCLSNPYPDACITGIRALPHARMIRGNEENYLENLIGQDPRMWNDGQMQISYWCYRNRSPQNRDFILSCPREDVFECCGVKVHVAHSSEAFIGDSELREWGPVHVALRCQGDAVSPETVGEARHRSLVEDAAFQSRLERLDDGVYVFGHSHLQWSYASAKGKKILINPGSCGLPLDCRRGMPYTLLDISPSGEITWEERRVPFDTEGYIGGLKQSDQYRAARVWSEIIIRELRTGREHLTFFLQYVREYVESVGDARRPFAVNTWEEAFAMWSRTNG